MKNTNTVIIVAIILIIVAAAGGFYLGMKYQNGRGAGLVLRNGGFQRFGAGAGANANFKAVRGQVLSMDGNTMTVKMSDGSTTIIVLSANTAYAQSQKAALSDLKTGDTVNVVGTSNSDGSLTAQDVQINPSSAPMMFRGGANGQTTASPSTGSGY